MYSQGCLDPSSQLVSLLLHAAGGSRPENPRVALPGCVVLLPTVSQNSPTSVLPLGCTSVLLPALASAASVCKFLAACTSGYTEGVLMHVPSPQLSSLLLTPPDCSVAGTQTLQQWVRQQRMEEYPDGYEHFLRLCLIIVCQMAQVGHLHAGMVAPSAVWPALAGAGCSICAAVLHMLQSSRSEQAFTGSSTSRGRCCSVSRQAPSAAQPCCYFCSVVAMSTQALACSATRENVMLHTPAG